MSFLLDPPALVIIGIVIDRYGDSRTQKNRIGAAVVAIFLSVSTLLYLDVLPWWWGGWIEGSDWMLNSGLPTTVERSPGIDILAVLQFAAYPLWMRLGLDLRTYLEDGLNL